MLEASLDPQLERTLAAIVARTRNTPGDFALPSYLEDLEYNPLAVKGWRANDPLRNLSSEYMLREFGLNG